MTSKCILLLYLKPLNTALSYVKPAFIISNSNKTFLTKQGRSIKALHIFNCLWDTVKLFPSKVINIQSKNILLYDCDSYILQAV